MQYCEKTEKIKKTNRRINNETNEADKINTKEVIIRQYSFRLYCIYV